MARYTFNSLASAYDGIIPVGAFASFINSVGENIDVQKPINIADDGKLEKRTGHMCLCEYCIAALRSHGENVHVGDPVDTNAWHTCEFCNETDFDIVLYDCILD